MRSSTIAKNYAEALLELARRAEDPAGWGKPIRDVANGVEQDITLKHFLESPKISAAQKNECSSRRWAIACRVTSSVFFRLWCASGGRC